MITDLVSELGAAMIWGPGAFLLGVALITLMVASRGVLPAWLRCSTLVAGVGGLASVAFSPSALLILWGIVRHLALVRAAGADAGTASALERFAREGEKAQASS